MLKYFIIVMFLFYYITYNKYSSKYFISKINSVINKIKTAKLKSIKEIWFISARLICC